jgi:hypothetical protein
VYHIQLFRIFEAEEEKEIISIPPGKLSPGFVIQEEFQNYRWLKPQYTHNIWYYRLPSSPIFTVPRQEGFGESLDPELKESVKSLHDAGIPTSPSCTGHWHSDENYQRIFKDLEKEAEQIRNKGILLRDPTDGKQYFYKNSRYKLPWDKSTFVEKASEHAKRGVIGIFDPQNIFYDSLLQANINYTQIIKSGDLTLFLTNPPSEESLKEIWKQFENIVISTLTKEKNA